MPISQLSGSIDLASALVGPGFLFRRYFSAAQALWPGLEQLSSATLEREDAYFLVAGFTSEVLLKALAAHNTEKDGAPRSDSIRGHDLCHLWSDAAQAELVSPAEPPPWLAAINVFHAAPYFIRYQEPGGFYSLPRRAETHAGLRELHSHVKSRLFPKGEA